MMEPLTRNMTVKTLTAAKQIESLKKKLREKNQAIQSEDLQPFRSLCCHEDLNTAIIACDAIVDFVKFNNFPMFQAIPWLVTLLQSTNNIRGITKATTELLLLGIRLDSLEKHLYLNSFQHPFITILKQDRTNWSVVEFQMQLMFNSDPDHVFAVLKRVFMYALWSPSNTVGTCCKRGLWRFLVKNVRANFDYFVCTMRWLQADDQNGALDVCYFLADLCEHVDLIEEQRLSNLLCIMLAENSCKMAEYGHQPELCLQLTRKLLKKYPATTDLVLLLFSRALLTCPARFLHHFIRTCLELINTNGFHDSTTVWMIISALLPWLVHPSSVISDVSQTADLIFDVVEKKNKRHSRASYLKELLKDDVFMQFIGSSQNGFWAFVLIRALENYSPAELLTRMNEPLLSAEDVQFNYILNLFISGLLLSNNHSSIQRSALDVLKNSNAGFQLPLILYMLSKTSGEIQFALLNTLPSTAVDKNNVSPILVMLDSFITTGEKVLIQHSIQLFLDLWKIEKRSYPYLSEHLVKNKVMPPDIDWEMDVIVASAIRDICTLEPIKYGKEWVGVLSDIMNRCSEQYGCLPFVLTLEAILRLCEAGVVNVLTVFEEFLKQHLFDDKRPRVIEKLCELVELIFQEIKGTTFEDHCGIVSVAIETMWKLTVTCNSKAIAVAAIKTLSKLDVGLVPLKVIPKEYRKDVKLPAEFAKKSNANAKPEDVLSYVPGMVWITYLQRVPEEIKIETCTMLSSWLQMELDQLGRGFYHSIRGESGDVSFLPDKSIFKTLVKYLKRLAVRSVPCSMDEIRTAALCLSVLCNENTKKLPQFNWAFLDQFLKYKNAELTRLVIEFFAKQCGISMSAKKGIENFVKSLDLRSCEEKELEMVLNMIPKMCCGVTPTIFSSILSSAVHRVAGSMSDCSEGMYSMICEKLSETLKQSNLDEHNRDAVCRSVIHLWQIIPAGGNEMFERLVDVVREMPFSYIEFLVSLEDVTDPSFNELVKLLMLSSTIALKENDNPFIWMNFCIQATAKCSCSSGKEAFFVFAVDVLRRHRLHSGKWIWLLQFFDQISGAEDEMSIMNKKTGFMFEVMVFSVVNLSSFSFYLQESSSIAECEEYFPQALNDIITEQVSSQVIEWLYHMSKLKKIGDSYRSLLKNALIALRYSKYFQQMTVWSKILSECF